MNSVTETNIPYSVQKHIQWCANCKGKLVSITSESAQKFLTEMVNAREFSDYMRSRGHSVDFSGSLSAFFYSHSIISRNPGVNLFEMAERIAIKYATILSDEDFSRCMEIAECVAPPRH